eukprot:gene37124-39704_t
MSVQGKEGHAKKSCDDASGLVSVVLTREMAEDAWGMYIDDGTM